MDFAISFDRLGRSVMSPLGAGPKFSHVRVEDGEVQVKLGWTFSSRFPLASVTDVRPAHGTTISRGAHGFRGKWLVNGAGRGLVSVTLDPPARAYVTGVPVKLRELMISVDDPDAVIAALRP